MQDNVVTNDWDRAFIKNSLRTAKCRVSFIKENGKRRDMLCTLDPDYLPPQTDLEEHVQSRVEKDYVCVWDLEVSGWRSFKYASLIAFEPLLS